MMAQRGVTEDSEARSLTYICHLCAEKRDARAFAPLCDLIATDETVAVCLPPSDELAGLLINLCDGDVEPLKRAIESPEGDEFTRGAALTALAYLVRERAVLSDDEMRDYLGHLRENMQPRSESDVWLAWACAVGRLGYESMRADVGHLFSRGWVPREDLDLTEFHGQLRLSRRDADGLAAFHEDGVRPSGPTIETYEPLDVFSRSGDEYTSDEEMTDSESYDVEAPYINPHRDVGRNDPCICGSGKKYKKCCLRAESP
jgi:hypothetical protein